MGINQWVLSWRWVEKEFIAMCKAMVEKDVTPDFITVDGGEGGTGAAPLEYTNSIGFPLREVGVC